MTNKEQQIKNSFIYLLPVIVSNLLPLLVLPIFTRILTKEDYGLFALAQIYALFISGLANFGMTVVYDRSFFQYRNSQHDSARTLYSILTFVLINYFLLTLFTYVFKGTLSKLVLGSADHQNILFWSFFAQIFTGASYYFLSYFKNSENAKSFTIYTIAASLINTVISVVLVIYYRIGVMGLVYAQVFSSAIIFCILSFQFIKVMQPMFSRAILVESVRISYPLTPLIFLGVIGSQFDKYMIGLLASVGGVGIYSIGQNVAYVAFNYMTAIQNVFSPQVYKRMFDLKEKGGESIGLYLTPFLYSSIFVALLIALFAEEIIFVLTPKSYHGAIDIVVVLSMLYGSYFFAKQPQLIFAKKTYISSTISIVSVGLNIVINIVLISKFGAMGAAWGTFIAGIITGIVTFIVSQYYYNIKWEYKKLGIIFLIFYGSSLLVLVIHNVDMMYGMRLMIKVLLLGTYIFYGMKLDYLNKKNYNVLKKMIYEKLRSRNVSYR